MKTAPTINRILLPWMITAVIFLLSCTPAAKTNQESGFPHVAWSKNASIYEVNLRQYTPEGTISAFEAHLPRLKELGVDILWFMPIHPVGEKNRKGSLGSYYSVKDYLAVDPAYGTMEDFKRLVDKIHEMGMYVIIDWVANHTAWDNSLLEQHPDFYTRDSAGNFVSPYDWTDVVDLNFDNPGLRKYMTDALVFWVKEAGIDGFRCDVAGMVPTEFWEGARMALDSVKPVFMLAEWEEPALHNKAFDMTYGWNLHHVMNDIAKGEKDVKAIDDYFITHDTAWPPDAYRMYFTSNHDENSWNGTEFERMGDAAAAFAVMSATVPGVPLIYSGQEAGLEKRLSFFDKDTILWRDHPMADIYKELLNLKGENEALWNGQYGGTYTRVENSSNNKVYTFMRKKGDYEVFTVLNLSPDAAEITLTGDAVRGKFNALFVEDPISIEASSVIKLGPWGYKVYYR